MTMSWCLQDEASAYGDAALATLSTATACVPGIWPLEVANVLAVCERRGRVTAVRIVEFLKMLGDLAIIVDDQTAKKAFGDVLTLARARQISAYDAAYLELAMREGCPLASLDGRLNGAAADLGIPLFEG
jgi:predicted nucleic acid-binding protein